ncbi:MAG: hypothetical protein SFW66_10380 [Gammaproteobacteria bacterium]|nr:hypothetical protein [Gammaproteobacteria bacterium]
MSEIVVKITYLFLHEQLEQFFPEKQGYFNRRKQDAHVQSLLYLYNKTLHKKKDDVLLSVSELHQLYFILQKQLLDDKAKCGKHSQQVFNNIKNEFDVVNQDLLQILQKLFDLEMLGMEGHDEASAESKNSDSEEYIYLSHIETVGREVFNTIMTHPKLGDLLTLISILLQENQEQNWNQKDFHRIFMWMIRLTELNTLLDKVVLAGTDLCQTNWWLSQIEKSPFDTANGIHSMQSIMSMFCVTKINPVVTRNVELKSKENYLLNPSKVSIGASLISGYPVYMSLFYYNQAHLSAMKRQAESSAPTSTSV